MTAGAPAPAAPAARSVRAAAATTPAAAPPARNLRRVTLGLIRPPSRSGAIAKVYCRAPSDLPSSAIIPILHFQEDGEMNRWLRPVLGGVLALIVALSAVAWESRRA